MVETIRIFRGFDYSSRIEAKWGGLEPVAEGENTTTCAAAIVPGGAYDSGYTEGFSRYLAGARKRHEVGLVVCELAANVPDREDVPPSGIWIRLPAEGGDVMGGRLPSGPRLEMPDKLSPPERDLALRLRNRLGEPPWYGLTRNRYSPASEFRPLLVTDVEEVVAAVWISPDREMQWFLLPWGVDWGNILDWIETQALPDLVPTALARARRAIEEDLLTGDEREAHSRLEAFDQTVETERLGLLEEITSARHRADERRYPLLFGSGKELADAVSNVMQESGMVVENLDETFGSGRSGDYLITHNDLHWLVEVTSSAGAMAEIEVGKLMAHVETWPRLRSEPIEAGVLVVNHDYRKAPSERPHGAYRRKEFVDSLKISVIGTIPLCRWWVGGDYEAIVGAITGPAGQVPNRNT